MPKIEIDAKVENLDAVNSFIAENTEGCPVKVSMQIDLAVEEVFVNIAHYAYETEGGGKAWITCDFDAAKRELAIIFEDEGKPFDPLAKEDPDITASAEERNIGGLGIFLTKKLMDDVRYENKGGRNVLAIVKKF